VHHSIDLFQVTNLMHTFFILSQCILYDMIYLSTEIGLTPGGSSTVHIYTQTIHRMTQNKQYIEQHNNLWECGPCPVLASYTVAFALQLRKKHGKTSVRVKKPSVSRTVCRLRADCSLLSTGILYGRLQRVTIPEAVIIQSVLLRMSKVLLETCWGL